MPCKHVMGAMYSMAQDGREVGRPEDWVHEAYWLKTWKETYNHKIIPVANSHFWPKCTIPSILLPHTIMFQLGDQGRIGQRAKTRQRRKP